MDRQSNPDFRTLREKHNLTETELEAHWKACGYSEHNTKALETIPQEKRDRIAKYYQHLRSIGILMHSTTKYYQGSSFPEPSTYVEKITRSDCKTGECQNCYVRTYPEKSNCEIRSREWMKSIDIILSKNRPPGEGQKLAEELIYYMNHEFMS